MIKSLQKLEEQLKEMEKMIPFLGSTDPEVSKVPVSWHLAHNLKVIHSILTGLKQSDPAYYRKKFSWKKEMVYLTGKIPRGKARAPKTVLPEEDLSPEELKLQISDARKEISEISALPKNAYFKHPFFGDISRDATPRFLVIHTEHHLKIMRDILTGSKKITSQK